MVEASSYEYLSRFVHEFSHCGENRLVVLRLLPSKRKLGERRDEFISEFYIGICFQQIFCS